MKSLLTILSFVAVGQAASAATIVVSVIVDLSEGSVSTQSTRDLLSINPVSGTPPALIEAGDTIEMTVSFANGYRLQLTQIDGSYFESVKLNFGGTSGSTTMSNFNFTDPIGSADVVSSNGGSGNLQTGFQDTGGIFSSNGQSISFTGFTGTTTVNSVSAYSNPSFYFSALGDRNGGVAIVVPEPAHYSVVFGALTLSLVGFRRRFK